MQDPGEGRAQDRSANRVAGIVIERFSVQIVSSRPGLNDGLLEKVATRIYQAALLHRVAVLTNPPRGSGTDLRSVIVADVNEDKDYINKAIRDNPKRLVGIYQLANRASHRELLSAITEDLQEVLHELA